MITPAIGLGLFLQVAFGAPSEWNGLSRAADTAREAKVELTAVAELDMTTLEGREVVVLIQPAEPLPIDMLEQFIRDGGSVLLFAEEGAVAPLLAHYGISWVSRPLDHQDTYEGHPGFPIFSKTTDSTLFFNMESNESTLVGNHPSALELPVPTRGFQNLVPYQGQSGRALVVEAKLGLGRLMLIGDTSILINEMQGKHGNKQFLANVLRRHCLKEPCEAIWTPPGASVTGLYAPKRRSEGQWAMLFQRLTSAIHQAVLDPKFVTGLSLLMLFTLLISFSGLVLRHSKDTTRISEAEHFIVSHRNKEKTNHV